MTPQAYSQNQVCPVCEIEYNEAICPQCGFEIKQMLVSPPLPYIQQLDAKRLEIARQNWNLLSQSKKDIQLLTKEKETLTVIKDNQKKEIEQLEKEKKRLELELKEALSRPVEEPIQGFLVVEMEEESLDGKAQRKIKDILPVYQGKNVFGKNPNPESAAHFKRILLNCKELQAEQFVIEGKADNSFIIKNISGISYLRNKSNILDSKEIELYNWDEVFIGDLVFMFIVK